MFSTLVSTAQLADHLGDWALVDCRFNLADVHAGLAAYRMAHIPGAVYASVATDLSAPTTGSNGRHPLPDADAMVRTFTRLGIGPDTQVVAYDDDTGMFASRLWWMLRYLGHDRVAVLDGGFTKWSRESRPIQPGEETRSPASFDAHPRTGWLVTIDDMVQDRAASALLVDARAPERFEGRVEPIDPVSGHIPGAINHFFKNNVNDDGTMREPETLRRHFEWLLGARAVSDTVMYCGSGVTACHNVLALAHAGLGIAPLFIGSWSEWSANADRPVETGPSSGRP